MTFRTLGVTLAAALAVTVVGAPASAAIVTMTYTGVVGTLMYNSGHFGPGDLTGLDFTASYVFDTSLGTHFLFDDAQYLYSGVGLGANPTISASLTINGLTALIDGGYSSGYYTTSFGISGNASEEHVVAGFFETKDLIIYVGGIVAPARFGAFSIDLTEAQSLASTGGFDIYGPGYQTAGQLLVQRLTMSTDEVATVVPEPATWALMLMGFGLAGGALRTRRRFA